MQTAYIYYRDQTPIMDTIHAWGERTRIPACIRLEQRAVAGEMRTIYSAVAGNHDYMVVDADEHTALLVRT